MSVNSVALWGLPFRIICLEKGRCCSAMTSFSKLVSLSLCHSAGFVDSGNCGFTVSPTPPLLPPSLLSSLHRTRTILYRGLSVSSTRNVCVMLEGEGKYVHAFPPSVDAIFSLAY